MTILCKQFALCPRYDETMIPKTMEDISPKWLSEVLSCSVHSMRRGELAGGIAITSQLAAFHLESTKGPLSVVVKLRRPGWKMDALYEREVRFYKELACDLGELVPLCYHIESKDDTGDFVILMEDLSAANPGHNLEGLTLQQGLDVAYALGSYHGKMWQDERAAHWPHKTFTAEDGQRLNERFAKQWPLLVSQGKYEIPAGILEIIPHIAIRLPQALQRMSQGAGTLIHSDVHAENLLLDGERVIIIDWQNAAFANASIDLAGLILCCDNKVQKEHWQEVLTCWRNRVMNFAVEQSEAEQVIDTVPYAILWNFVGVSSWLATFEAEKLRDGHTLQCHWRRLVSGLQTTFPMA